MSRRYRLRVNLVSDNKKIVRLIEIDVIPDNFLSVYLVAKKSLQSDSVFL
jgi:hypothetical protein